MALVGAPPKLRCTPEGDGVVVSDEAFSAVILRARSRTGSSSRT